ncbi:30S ribosomal protein S12 methylthiotransferase RimO [Corallococcus praedator]|uniref:Ribosomal protein uS12 methylthiotransferase RimO n=2 Tax=Myxococcaceae TaxID=31 RepID=A0ABX9Q880_9BACT|nr:MULTISPECIES: 30S ribosomal protein S12 methylthiotransferase RimO [Corallococcus]RKH08439.1 30S ribosomal protein S12 methylthiotransferase RimO [Corallococcus sp. CA047B]RKH23783.1 30S ribosomal protein S12 methylthiotransferase RimO [Corallococcus sp. CA031C]RKH92959.1 30S ribosomal protein S12 methylthiotransferase RimO [Corallococcus praedator]
MEDTKSLYMMTLGCPKNRVDSEVMLGTLRTRGYSLVQDPAAAQVIVVNTCAFIGPAKQESVDSILEMAELKKTGACKTLVVTGCLSQRYGQDLSQEMPEVDHFLGTSAYAQIGDLLAAEASPRQVIPDPDYIHNAQTPRINSMPKYTAYLKISEGCDNACAFCIIPTLRGGQRSRTVEDIMAEARNLADSGVQELNLVAQDLTAYGHDLPGKPKLHELLKELVKVDVKWIRLHYAYPRVFPDELIDVIASEPKIANYLDMPVQHASDKLLMSMKRGRNSKFLKELLTKLRERVPNLVMRTSLIVGLPGETEEDFELLKEFVKEQRFQRLGVFQYSDEEGTSAFDLPNKVPAKTIERRWREVMAIQKRINREQNKKLVGQKLTVLVEGPSEESEHLLVGRHEGQAPEIDGQVYINDGLAYPGEFVTVEVTEAHDYDLIARVVERPDPKQRTHTPREALPAPVPMKALKRPAEPRPE